jgi:starch-binding outer membrane protein, SusD/RagB family
VMGEARFLRAFCYYYLTAFFGDVPLVLETDAKKTAFLPRAPVAEVYRQMIADLQAADGLLTNDNSNAFAGKLACEALLARVYLHGEDWSNAEKYSTAVIGSGLLALETDLDRAFLRPSKETIFQLEPVSRPYNAMEGHLFGVPAFDKAPVYDLLPGLAAAFEPGDRRKAHWTKSYTVGGVTYHIPYKYKIYWSGSASNEYNVVLRLAEQYLIRAEARARQANIAGAVDDLNVIRHRAGLPGLSPTMTSGECLLAIEKERRLELFTEWGHRWFDLRRTGRAHAVLSLVKGPYWDRTDQLYPVPEGEIQLNPHLSQNEGYY